MSKKLRLMTKKGVPIIGTLEILHARADIDLDSVRLTKSGKIKFDYDGNTEVFWDGQMTATNDDGRRVFLTEDGDEVAEGDVLVVGDDEDDE